jgi:hypothetical protein
MKGKTMSTASKVPSGDDQNPGGELDTKTKDDASGGGDSKPKAPSYETYQKVLDEAKKAKEALREYQRKEKEAEDAKLKQQGEYQKILEQREAELKQEREEKQTLKDSIQNGKKLNAILGKLTGELPSQYWSLVDLEKIAVNPETGAPDEASVLNAAKEFEKQFPHVVVRKTTSKLPNDDARGASGKLTYKDWLALPLKEQRERMKDVDKTTL